MEKQRDEFLRKTQEASLVKLAAHPNPTTSAIDYQSLLSSG